MAHCGALGIFWCTKFFWCTRILVHQVFWCTRFHPYRKNTHKTRGTKKEENTLNINTG